MYHLNHSFFLKTIYLAVSGLGCGARDLCCIEWDLSLQRINSLVVVREISCSTACGILVPRPWIEPMSPALKVNS